MKKILAAILPAILISVLLIAGCSEKPETGVSVMGSIIDCEEHTGQGFEAGDPAPIFQFVLLHEGPYQALLSRHFLQRRNIDLHVEVT